MRKNPPTCLNQGKVMSSELYALGGVVVGVFLNHFSMRFAVRGQWFADNRKLECRELLTALSSASIALAFWYNDLEQKMLATPQGSAYGTIVTDFAQADRILKLTIGDRLFIAKEVRRTQIKKRWDAVVSDQSKKTDFAKQTREIELIANDIILMAATEDQNWWE
jgi:hypothetical protein